LDEEFLQYVEEMEYYNLLGLDDAVIVKYKKTLHYQRWQLNKVWAEFKESMQKSPLGSLIISIFEFMDKCVSKL